jgi:hypothetical protein
MLDDKDRYHPRRFEELAADPVPPSLINEVVQEDVRELRPGAALALRSLSVREVAKLGQPGKPH